MLSGDVSTYVEGKWLDEVSRGGTRLRIPVRRRPMTRGVMAGGALAFPLAASGAAAADPVDRPIAASIERAAATPLKQAWPERPAALPRAAAQQRPGGRRRD